MGEYIFYLDGERVGVYASGTGACVRPFNLA
jgi:hypothetical protein